MDVPLAQEHVRLALQLDLAAVFRLEQNMVISRDGPDVLAYRDDPCPRQPTADRSRGRDHDAARAATLTEGRVLLDEYSVVEQLDGQGVRHDGQGYVLRAQAPRRRMT